MYNEVDYFEALDRKFRFIKMSSPTIMFVAEYVKDNKGWSNDVGWHKEVFGGLDVRDVGAEVLKTIKVWPELADEVKKEINDGITKKTQAVHELMAVARKGRKTKYIGVPKDVECIKCHSKVVVVPRLVMAKIDKVCKDEKRLYTLTDYIAGFVCRVCAPVKRGKKANPEMANFPKTMKCKCGKEVITNVYYLKAKANKLGTTIQKLIDGFKCQNCEKTKGRPKKKKS